jgi:hypothetical protein
LICASDFELAAGHAYIAVAVMRKMITTLNAMVRDDVAWADHLSGRHSVATAR